MSKTTGTQTQETQQTQLNLDLIMKDLLKLSPGVVLGLINNLFHEHFDRRDVTITYTNSEFVETIHNSYSHILGDLFIDIKKGSRVFGYHLEFQTLFDGTIVIRAFQYGLEKAFEKADFSKPGKPIIVEFPKQLIIQLEENDKIGENIAFTLVLPDKTTVEYQVPVMRYWEYGIDELTQKRMYALLPLQVFKFRKKIATIARSRQSHKEKSRLITLEFEKLVAVVKKEIEVFNDLYENDDIVGNDMERLLVATNNISEYLYNNYGEYDKTGREVNNMITTLNITKIEQKSKREGERKGIREGERKGEIDLLLRQLNKKFGLVPDPLERKIKALKKLKTIETLGEMIFDIQSLGEVEKYIAN